MYRFAKNFHILKSFVQSKNFRIAIRKRLCREKTFAKQKVSRIKKTFAFRPVREQAPTPTAKKVDPLPLWGVKEIKLKYELVPLPSRFKKCNSHPSVWFR